MSMVTVMPQIAVNLPERLLTTLDRLVATGNYDSRSQAVRAALEQLVERGRAREIDAGFADGFRAVPERPKELADARRLALEAIADEPWERWW